MYELGLDISRRLDNFGFMEITFLGTGTSQGVPMIAHDSEGCDLSNAKNWRTRSSMHVKLGNCHVQIDASPEFRLQCIRNDVQELDLFILTHQHADHILGMDDLRRFCDLKDYGAIPVYSTPEALERVRDIYPYAIRERPVRKGYAAFNLSEMPAVLEVEGGRIYSTRLPHGDLEVLGLVFEETASGRRFAYYNDCKRVPEEAMKLAKGADVVVLDGLRPDSHPTHMSIYEAIEVAQEINAPETYLTHLTFRVDHETWSKQLPERVFLAYDALKLCLA